MRNTVLGVKIQDFYKGDLMGNGKKNIDVQQKVLGDLMVRLTKSTPEEVSTIVGKFEQKLKSFESKKQLSPRDETKVAMLRRVIDQLDLVGLIKNLSSTALDTKNGAIIEVRRLIECDKKHILDIELIVPKLVHNLSSEAVIPKTYTIEIFEKLSESEDGISKLLSCKEVLPALLRCAPDDVKSILDNLSRSENGQKALAAARQQHGSAAAGHS